MEIRVAETAGFCFGVKRAVELVEQTIREGKQAVTLGPIIHNRHVVQHFNDLGVREIADVDAIPDGSTVIIRSHGVGRAVYEKLGQRGLSVVDATCPFVSRIHELVRKGEAQGRQPVIIGTRAHPEVAAIAGWCRHPLIFETPEELEIYLTSSPEIAAKPLFLVFQTTSTQFLYKKCAEISKKVCTNCEIFDTICKATEDRQSEAAALATSCDAMIVVGDRTSSNTGKLAAICRQHKLGSFKGRTSLNEMKL